MASSLVFLGKFLNGQVSNLRPRSRNDVKRRFVTDPVGALLMTVTKHVAVTEHRH